MIFDGFVNQLPDIDPLETREWLDSLDAVIDQHGKTRARYLLSKLLERAREQQVSFPATVSTPYVNTIPPEREPWFPGDEHLERRIRAYIRWNAAVMVINANKQAEGIGGHLSTFASSASCTRSASTTSSVARTTVSPVTTSTSRATQRPARTPAPTSKAA
jgi:pyruvate dehydrogenase E1 component